MEAHPPQHHPAWRLSAKGSPLANNSCGSLCQEGLQPRQPWPRGAAGSGGKCLRSVRPGEGGGRRAGVRESGQDWISNLSSELWLAGVSAESLEPSGPQGLPCKTGMTVTDPSFSYVEGKAPGSSTQSPGLREWAKEGHEVPALLPLSCSRRSWGCGRRSGSGTRW